MGAMGTKLKELIPFLTDYNNRVTSMVAITDRMTDLLRRQQELTDQQANAAHILATFAQNMKGITATMRDDFADFDDQFRPIRNYFYWEPHCFDIPMCQAFRSLFDMTDQLDKMADEMNANVEASMIQATVTPRLAELIGQSADALQSMRAVMLAQQSTTWPMLTQMDELGRQMIDLGQAFDSSKNDEFFYLPPEAFDNPSFQIDLKFFVAPDGKSARFIVYHDGEALSPEGIEHSQAYLPAAKEALKGTTSQALACISAGSCDLLGHPGCHQNRSPDCRDRGVRPDLSRHAAHYPQRRCRDRHRRDCCILVRWSFRAVGTRVAALPCHSDQLAQLADYLHNLGRGRLGLQPSPHRPLSGGE